MPYSGYPCNRCVYNEIPSNKEPCRSCGRDYVNFEEMEVEADENNSSDGD